MVHLKLAEIVYLFLIFAISAAVGQNDSSVEDNFARIINGQVPQASLGFVVSIQLIQGSQFKKICAGSIISANFVVTAGHCVDRQDKNLLSIQAGTNDLSETGIRCNVEGYKVHESYLTIGVNDIAIIKVTPPLVLNGDTISSINFNSADVVEDRVPVVMAGWGATSLFGLTISFPFFTGTNSNQKLRTIRVTTLSNERCEQFYPQVTATEICTQTRNGGACKGDAGGPVINTSGTLLIGIIIYGPKACTGGSPDVHTRVSEFGTWITTKMAEVYT